MKQLARPVVWIPILVATTLILGAVIGGVTALTLNSPPSETLEVAVSADHATGPIEEAPTAGQGLLPVEEAAVTTATTTQPPTTTTTTPSETDFQKYRWAYDDGWDFGYQLGLVALEIPDVVWEGYESDDPEEFGYAVGYLDGWDAGYAVWAADDSASNDPEPAPTPEATSPPVNDRGYDQGWQDGYEAGMDDGWNGTWNANAYVVGQGPNYTDGFYEAYDTYYSVSSQRRSTQERSQNLSDSISSISCMMGGLGCDD